MWKTAILATMFGMLSAAHAQAPGMAFIAGISSPEDLVQLPASPWIVVSAMRSELARGRLVLVNSSAPDRIVELYPSTSPRPALGDPSAFAPHGLAVQRMRDGRVILLVVSHGGGEFVDRFELMLSSDVPPRAAAATRIALPTSVSANGVTALPDGGFALTSMFDPRDRAYVDKLARREPTGAVWRWTVSRGFAKVSDLQLSGANGIAASRDGRTLFVAEWAANRVWRIPLGGGEAESVATSFHPDNLRWTESGDLLVAGHVGETRELFSCKPGRPPCPQGYVVARIDPTSLAVKPIFTVDGAQAARDRFGGATGAIQVGDMLWIGTYVGDRIARIPLPKR